MTKQYSLNDIEETIRKNFSYDKRSGKLFRKFKNGSKKEITAVSHGYLCCNIKNKFFSVHRIIWFICKNKWPSNEIDHKDGNRSNNKIKNLREATRSQNSQNKKKPENNTSGFKGVSFKETSGKWRAYIKVDGVNIHLGYYKSAKEAHKAYKKAAVNNYGKFARSK
jgi:hypothetical protein